MDMKLFAIASNKRLARAFALAAALLIAPAVSSASVFVSVNFAPPPLLVYEQPICPGPDYIWVPGYWAWAPEGYYWVPGYWELAPFFGALWTPGWWGWSGVAYVWHPGYWGRHVGYYGGINYGFGYFGIGFSGGYWSGGHFRYNTAVTRVDVSRVSYVYSQPVATNNVHISYNGGAGGVRHSPTAQERLAEREPHRSATSVQLQHERFAGRDRQQLASVNHGSPAIVATPRVNQFHSAEVGRRGATTAQVTPQDRRAETSRGERAAPQERRSERIAPQERHAETSRGERAAPQERHAEAFRGDQRAAQERHAETFRAEHPAPQAPRAETFRAERPAPQERRPETSRAERGGPPANQPQARSFDAPRGGAPQAGSPPHERVAGGPNGAQGRPEGGGREGDRHEGRHEGG
jgi:hypothetical protein